MGSSSSSRSGWTQQQPGQRHAPALAAGQAVDRAVAGRAAQRVHRLVEHLVELPGARRVDLVLQARELVRGLVGVVHRQLVEAVQELAQPAHAVLDVGAHVLGLVQVRLLLEQPDGGAGCELGVAAVVLVDAGHDPEQGRLPGPVETQDPDLGARIEAERDVLQDGLVRRMDPAQLVHRVDVLARHRALEHRKRPTGETIGRILGPTGGARRPLCSRLSEHAAADRRHHLGAPAQPPGDHAPPGRARAPRDGAGHDVHADARRGRGDPRGAPAAGATSTRCSTASTASACPAGRTSTRTTTARRPATRSSARPRRRWTPTSSRSPAARWSATSRSSPSAAAPRRSTWPAAARCTSTSREHRQTNPAYEPSHAVKVVANSRLARILRARTLEVNSFHHQAVDRLGAGLRIVARAQDGTVEGDRGRRLRRRRPVARRDAGGPAAAVRGARRGRLARRAPRRLRSLKGCQRCACAASSSASGR